MIVFIVSGIVREVLNTRSVLLTFDLKTKSAIFFPVTGVTEQYLIITTRLIVRV